MNLSRRTLLASAAATPLLTGTGLALGAGEAVASPAKLRGALDYGLAKLKAVAPGITSFPEITRFEKWTYVADGGWVGGFWPGTLWLAHLDSGDARFRALAEAANERLAPRRLDPRDHDLGFLFSPSWVTAHRLTGGTRWRDGAIEAAATLLQRWNPAGRFLRAWGRLGTPDNAGRVIIDTMMNLDLLAFATEQTGDRRFLDIAIAHARTTQAHFLRADGSTPHVFDFDPDTGAAVGPNTVQGYSPTSCWSRGQSWGIYGFTTMYRRTGLREFRDTARKMADYALSVLTPDNVPVWDYRSPLGAHDVKDSSAGAILACGLLDLAKATGSDRYRDRALQILDGLVGTCLTTASARAEAVLARGTRNRPAEDGVEVSLPYGDYYLFEAILRVLKPAQIAKAIGL
ncbi:unsaturated chondroitin disaccharide hydrolase [Lentzea xinjiangensis]|uniref:Unsaturated chondroitin disaccharide hydrolase n=1 Tax=Lentzea xinjiangensis TaxID=402600 RepID=A0A1H9QIM1_9PSEU|nr:glycoside hydrolase family 88 protein [Lentzea xinjiangensis]SER60278.1 unsaturated chondroitin disaccharide hydrolase [Lentzea xinjiangensis]